MITQPLYRTDLINAVMGASRLTNVAVAELAGVGSMTVFRVRNGDPNVTYIVLKKVADALGITMSER